MLEGRFCAEYFVFHLSGRGRSGVYAAVIYQPGDSAAGRTSWDLRFILLAESEVLSYAQRAGGL